MGKLTRVGSTGGCYWGGCTGGTFQWGDGAPLPSPNETSWQAKKKLRYDSGTSSGNWRCNMMYSSYGFL